MNNHEELSWLIKSNPDLPVIAWVEEEIVASDEHRRWIAKIGKSWIDSICVYHGEHYLLSEVEKIQDVLMDNIYEQQVVSTETAFAKVEEALHELSWERVIIVEVNTPGLKYRV